MNRHLGVNCCGPELELFAWLERTPVLVSLEWFAWIVEKNVPNDHAIKCPSVARRWSRDEERGIVPEVQRHVGAFGGRLVCLGSPDSPCHSEPKSDATSLEDHGLLHRVPRHPHGRGEESGAVGGTLHGPGGK